MSKTHTEQLADAVLYEGYNLYPYRPSALKNRYRWLFGCAFPRRWCDGHSKTEQWQLQTQCLLVGGPLTTIEVRVRFLQPTKRIVGQCCEASDPSAIAMTGDDGTVISCRPVDSLEVDGTTYHSWQEAEEHCLVVQTQLDAILKRELETPIESSASCTTEILVTESGKPSGVMIRRRNPLAGRITVSCVSCLESSNLYRLGVRIDNLSDCPDSSTATRGDALLSSLVSMQVTLHVVDGEFVSTVDPPSRFQGEAELCENIGLWPVLVGDPRQPTTMLAAPIILEDFAEIAPESPGDLFDGTEIDELLTLRIRTLTAQEKREAASADKRTRQLVQRAEVLDKRSLQELHATRFRASVAKDSCDRIPQEGDRVRLRPRRRADAFDLMLDGKTAVVANVERDFEDNVHVAVTVDDDPGRDLGLQGMPGHRFFFRLDEIEFLEKETK